MELSIIEREEQKVLEKLGIKKLVSETPTGTMSIMNTTGDTKSMWDSRNPDQVQAARDQFDYLVKEKGYKAFSVKKDGSKNEQIREFDPSLQSIILSPPLVGG